MSKGKSIIRYERLEYVPKYIIVDEDNSDEVYYKLKKQNDIRNLRRT